MAEPRPKVSVALKTYNQERFLPQAIESVLAQRADFSIELVIGEDCSPDGTGEVARGYAARHPARVRVLPREKNIGMVPNLAATYEASRGEYVAFLDGDDYWTDPLKLAKQVALMESDPSLAACFGGVMGVDETGAPIREVRARKGEASRFGVREVIRGECTVHTGSMMVRSVLGSRLPPWFPGLPIGDLPMLILHARHGAVALIDEVMSAYRVHGEGVWSRGGVRDGSARARRTRAHRWEALARTFSVLRRELGGEWDGEFAQRIAGWNEDLASLYRREREWGRMRRALREGWAASPGYWLRRPGAAARYGALAVLPWLDRFTKTGREAPLGAFRD